MGLDIKLALVLRKEGLIDCSFASILVAWCCCLQLRAASPPGGGTCRKWHGAPTGIAPAYAYHVEARRSSRQPFRHFYLRIASSE